MILILHCLLLKEKEKARILEQGILYYGFYLTAGSYVFNVVSSIYYVCTYV